MKTTMTLAGIGTRLMLMCLPYIILALSVEFKYPEFLNIGYFDQVFFKYLGLFWLAAGFAFWISSVITFLTDFKTGKLITRGTFAWCRNPVYASMIIFIIPAFALVYHSGLIASIMLVFYIGFKISIHGETILLERTFGNEYEIYRQSVNELLPFPRFIFKNITPSAKETIVKVICVVLLLVNGSGALYGGFLLMSDPSGSKIQLPLSFLEHSPFSNYLIPGIILFIVNGLFSLVTIGTILYKNVHFYWFVIIQGLLLSGWILVQIILIRMFYAPYHAPFLIVGVCLIGSGLYQMRHQFNSR